MKKKFSIVTVLSLVLLLVFQMSVVSAAEGRLSEALPAITQEDASSLHAAIDNAEPITQLMKAAPADGLNGALQHTIDTPVNLNDAASIQPLTSSLRTLAESTSSVTTATYTGVIPKEGEAVHLYPIYVKPGEVLQVQLDPPLSPQLNYDLYLYEFDMATGNIITTPIDQSIYGTYMNNYENGTRTLSENVGTKNTTSGVKAYLVEVLAKQGGSINDPFTVTLAVSSEYDAYETDENAFHAYGFTVNTSGSSLNTRSISSPIDNDWFAINVPENRNYDALNLTLDNTSMSKGHKVEVYGAYEGNQMRLLSSPTDKNVRIGTGTFYVRVYTTGQYDNTNYTLTVRPVLRADKISIIGFNSKEGPNDYPTYQYGRHFRAKDTLTVSGKVTTSDNFAVANAKVDVLWLNKNWTEGSGNRTRTASVYTDANGNFTATLSLPASTGSIMEFLPGPINFTHYYDLSGINVQVSERPNVSATDIIYHFAYSLYGGRG
ncbi:carboxypeptidase-like regulatory domain-containing protein [Paenibacillus sp. S-12]|uniref:carboxypeptidase-like regulatory domain-containing protein n=1 Tax=Paenibacillus sp. S-12 TaxID=3031371 RepID=UPI0025A0B1A1|nr:carboxypeptidase-like regulatory domain-containing protein [Paenibacillus sp. S-12]